MGYAAGERLQVDARRRWPIYVFPDLIGLSCGSMPCRLPARPQRRPAERRRSSSPQQGQGEQKSGATDRLRRRRGRRETRGERSIAFGGRGERESANDSDRGGESDGERQLPAPDDEQDNAKEDVVVHSLTLAQGLTRFDRSGPARGGASVAQWMERRLGRIAGGISGFPDAPSRSHTPSPPSIKCGAYQSKSARPSRTSVLHDGPASRP